MNDSRKERSLKRARKTSLTLGEAFGPDVMSAIVPGGGIAFKLAQALARHSLQWYKDRNEERLVDFCSVFLTGDVSDVELNKLLERKIPADTYSSVLRAVIQDDEDDKATFYGNLLKQLSKGKTSSSERLRLVKLVKSLSCQEIDFLRVIYVHDQHSIIGSACTTVSVGAALEGLDTKGAPVIPAFLSQGLLRQEGDSYECTQLLRELILSLYVPKDLRPTSIGKREWSGLVAIIVLSELGSKVTSVKSRIENRLLENRVKHAHTARFRESDATRTMLSRQIIILVISSKPMHEESRKALATIKIRKLVIKAFLQNDEGKFPEDPVPGIEACEEVLIEKDLVTGIDKLDTCLDTLLERWSDQSQ